MPLTGGVSEQRLIERQAGLKDGDVIDAHLAPDVKGGCLVCGRGHERAREWWSEYYRR